MTTEKPRQGESRVPTNLPPSKQETPVLTFPRRPRSAVAKPLIDAHGIALSTMQRAFATSYLANGGRVVAAAIEAGYSARSAKTRGGQILRSPKVQAYLANILGKPAIPTDIPTTEQTDLPTLNPNWAVGMLIQTIEASSKAGAHNATIAALSLYLRQCNEAKAHPSHYAPPSAAPVPQRDAIDHMILALKRAKR